MEIPLDAIPQRPAPRKRAPAPHGFAWSPSMPAVLIVGGLTLSGTLAEMRDVINGRTPK